MEKKLSANWYIAATHYLTAGFVVPIVFGLIVALFLKATAMEIPIDYLNLVLSPLVVFLGVLYSQKYVNKTYVITNAQKIVALSTAYVVILRGIFEMLRFAKDGFGVHTVTFALVVIVFYVFSKKYIQNTPVI